MRYTGYCVKCRTTRFFDGLIVVTRKGRHTAQGPCDVCGTRMVTFVRKDTVAP